MGLVQEGQRHLKSLTEGGFGCIVTSSTVQEFSYRKKNITGKKSILLNLLSTTAYKVTWKLLKTSTELHREVRDYKGSPLC